MKRIKKISVCICCLLAISIALLNGNFSVYAAEEDNQELSFNSVVEVESYSIEAGYLEPGEEATISLSLHNANKHTAANGLVVIASSESRMVYPKYGEDNTFYVGKLDANESTTVTIPVVVMSGIDTEFLDFTCVLVYECGGKQITNSSTMVLPVKTDYDLTVNSLDVSAHATVNSKSLLSISCTNNGTESIDDAILTVDGNVSEASGRIVLGSIAAGKTYTKDYNVIFTEAGEQKISITLSYTDKNGESATIDVGNYTVIVGEESQLGQDTTVNNEALDKVGKIIAVIALLAAFVVSLVYIKKR